MTNMVSEIYDALTAAGAPEDKARKAAEVMAMGGDRLDKLQSTVETRFAKNEGDMVPLKWMLGFVFAILVTLLFLTLKGRA